MKTQGKPAFIFGLIFTITIGILSVIGVSELRRVGIDMYETHVRSYEYAYNAVLYFNKSRIEYQNILLNCFKDDKEKALAGLGEYENYAEEFIYWMNRNHEISATEEIKNLNIRIINLFGNNYLLNSRMIIQRSIDSIPNYKDNASINFDIESMAGTEVYIEDLLNEMMSIILEATNEFHNINILNKRRLIMIQVVFIITMLTCILFVALSIKRNSELSNKVHYDGLTGIYNRRYLDENLNHLTKYLSRSRSALSILMIDIDFFKKYNDAYGHQAGDNCLKLIADIISKSITREDDFVARYGGEEFIVVLPYTGKAGACTTASKLLEKVLEHKIPHKNSKISPYVTVSIGITTVHVKHTQSYKEYINCADKALYMSKHSGRNKLTYLDLEELEIPELS